MAINGLIYRERMHKQKSILNHVKPIWIVITLFPFIWNQIEFHLVPNQSKKCDYNPNLVWINMILRTFLRVKVDAFFLFSVFWGCVVLFWWLASLALRFWIGFSPIFEGKKISKSLKLKIKTFVIQKMNKYK